MSNWYEEVVCTICGKVIKKVIVDNYSSAYYIQKRARKKQCCDLHKMMEMLKGDINGRKKH